jgi:hypothetical protein
MAHTFYAQRGNPTPTLTVGELIDRLRFFDPALPVVFKSPLYGSFGSNTAYSLETVAPVSLERVETHYPAFKDIDDETGEEVEIEAYTDVRHAWSGVIIG